jgi:GDPmannose 4,6-dehydratase
LRIKRGEAQRLLLGNIDIARDWRAAPEYVDAMWRIMQLDNPTDLVIATGKTHSLEEFVAAAFDEAGLDWQAHVDVEARLKRPSDLAYSAGNPAKAHRITGWHATSGMREVVRMMVRTEMGSQEAAAAWSKA